MKSKRRWRQVLLRQSAKLVYKVLSYFACKEDACGVANDVSVYPRHRPSFVSASIVMWERKVKGGTYFKASNTYPVELRKTSET
jgi:hypothetical protein